MVPVASPGVGLVGGQLVADRVGRLDQMVGERLKLRQAHALSRKPREGKTVCYLQTEMNKDRVKLKGEEIYRLLINLMSRS